MNSKIIFLLMIAIGCGSIAAVAGSQIMNQKAAVAPERPMIQIVVASSDIDVAAKITAEKFRLESWPQDRMPKGAVMKLSEVEGKFTNQRMYVGEPLLEGKVMNSSNSITQTIPEGFRVFDLPIGDSGYIRPGDRVDVVGFFEKSNKIAQTKSMRVMEDVSVLMVDGNAIRDPEETKSKSAKTVQLLIKASQYDALNIAANLGKMKLSLRGTEAANETGSTDNGEEFLSWVADSVQSDPNPTAGAPQLPEALFTSMPLAPPTPEVEEQFSMLVYSGGMSKEYRWTASNPRPQLVDAKTNSTATLSPATPAPAVQTPPPGKFTGEQMQWDELKDEWMKTDLKSDPTAAETKTNASW